MKKYKLTINGEIYETKILTFKGDYAKVDVNGVEYKIEIEREGEKTAQPSQTTAKDKQKPVTSAPLKAKAITAAPSIAGAVIAPIPGTVLDIKVGIGDKVVADDVVLILEAMKMESEIHAGTNGVVKSINVAKGDSVQENAVLIEIGAE